MQVISSEKMDLIRKAKEERLRKECGVVLRKRGMLTIIQRNISVNGKNYIMEIEEPLDIITNQRDCRQTVKGELRKIHIATAAPSCPQATRGGRTNS